MKSTISLITLSFFLLITAKAQQTINKTIAVDGVERKYIVYVPALYDGSKAVPLMFNFHGYTGNANGHMNAIRMRPVADTACFILVFPQGSLFFGNTHWSVGSWTNGSNANDLGFTEAMINSLAEEYNIDLDRVYSCGYSNGGYFSFELACQLSDRIAAIGSVGGKMSSETYNTCNPIHPTPVITIHGTNDNVVDYYGSNPAGSKNIRETNQYWITYNSTDTESTVNAIPNTNTFDGSTVEHQAYLNGDNCTAVEHYKVIGGGHDWPGAWGNRDIDASSLIWNFVSQYNINGLIECSGTTNTKTLVKNKELLIFPNPARRLITIENTSSNLDYHIYSLTGTLLQSGHTNSKQTTIDISDLSPSVYVLKIGEKNIKLIKG